MLQGQAAAAANPPPPALTPAQAKLAALKAASASPKVHQLLAHRPLHPKCTNHQLYLDWFGCKTGYGSTKASDPGARATRLGHRLAGDGWLGGQPADRLWRRAERDGFSVRIGVGAVDAAPGSG